MGYAVVNIEDVPAGGPGGAVRFVRREVGAEAFGVNWFDLGPGAEGYPHDEAESGQEEVYLIVKGSGHWVIDGTDEVPVQEGSFLRVDPTSKRYPVAGAQGLSFVAIGACPGSYEARGPF